MAVIGTLGDTVFSVSNKLVKTFDEMKWESSARYATHDRHLKVQLIEFLGTDAESITFNMHFSAYLGVNPLNELTKLLKNERSGKVMRLVIGPKTYGRNKWVIDKTSIEMQRFDGKGNLIGAKVAVSLKEYAAR